MSNDDILGKFKFIVGNTVVAENLSSYGLSSILHASLLKTREGEEYLKKINEATSELMSKVKVVCQTTNKFFIPKLIFGSDFLNDEVETLALEAAKDSNKNYNFRTFGLIHLGLLELKYQKIPLKFWDINVWSRSICRNSIYGAGTLGMTPWGVLWSRDHKEEIIKYRTKQRDMKKFLKIFRLTGIIETEESKRTKKYFLTDKGLEVLSNVEQKFKKQKILPKVNDIQFTKVVFNVIKYKSVEYLSTIYDWIEFKEFADFWKQILVDFDFIDAECDPTDLGVKFIAENAPKYFSWYGPGFLDNRTVEAIETMKIADQYLLNLVKDSWGIIISEAQSEKVVDYLKELMQ